MEKKLPIKIPAPMECYLPIGIMSSIAAANLGDNTWILNNFIQLFKYDCQDKIESFPIQNFMYFDQDMFRVNELSDQNYNFKRETFLDDMMGWIDKGNYVVAYVNEALLRNVGIFGGRELLHSQLVVGYDEQKELFTIVNFSNKTYHLELLDVSFADLEQAFFDESTMNLYTKESTSWLYKGKMHMAYLIRFIGEKGAYYDYGLNYKHMISEMDNYLASRDSSINTNYFTGHLEGRWGMDIYDEIIKMLKDENNPRFDYRVAYLLYEHKYYMKERLAIFEREDKKYSQQYEKVLEYANLLRMSILKEFCRERKLPYSKISEFISSIADSEKEILGAFLKEYKQLYCD